MDDLPEKVLGALKLAKAFCDFDTAWPPSFSLVLGAGEPSLVNAGPGGSDIGEFGLSELRKRSADESIW